VGIDVEVVDRPRAGALGSEAIAELNANAGTQFDPEVVTALVRVLGRSQPVDERPVEAGAAA
jgi:HD-GYP domain-containing protein (c-di-GMP phosphodiesterase class II)